MVRITIEDGVPLEVAKLAASKALDIIHTRPGVGLVTPLEGGVTLTVEPLDRDGKAYRVTVQVTW